MKEEIDLESRKFLSDANNNVTNEEIEVSIPSKKQAEFIGLTKDQVLKYGSSPSWVRARWIIFILFWLALIGMIVASVLFVYFTPKCAKVVKLAWYQKDVAYQIDVENFKDSNGDGIGDLGGIEKKLGYLEKLGVKTLYLNNILDSDKKVAAKYGSEDALKSLKKKLESEDMHIILEVPANILDKALLEDLLKNKVDGVMLSNVNDLPQGEQKLADAFNSLKEIADDISRKTFKAKFLGTRLSDLTNVKELEKSDLVLVDKEDQALEEVEASSLLHHIKSASNDESKPEWKTFSTGSLHLRPNSGDSEDIKKRRGLKNGILLFLKGSPFFKYGDELNYDDQSGSIMKWDESVPGCGFSNVTNQTIKNCIPNVQEENSHGSDLTQLKFIRKLISIRSASNSQSFQWGQIKFVDSADKGVIAFSREADGFDGFLIVANLGEKAVRFDYAEALDIPEDGTVVFYNLPSTELAAEKSIHTNNLFVKPYGFLIVKFNRNPAPQESKASSGVGH